MVNKPFVMAKLAGIYKTLSTLLGPQGNRQLLHSFFNSETVTEIFDNYIKQAQSLKDMMPDLYDELSIRALPTPEEGNFFKRDFVETIFRDIEYIFELNSQFTASNSKETALPLRIFISHGSSKDWMQIQNFIEKDLKIDTLELAAEPNKGRTVLQKLNEESNKCSYAVVVMSGDDVISENETRARENVMHEIGFFQGKYGLDKVSLLYEEGTNIPSNINGLVYIGFPKNTINSTFGSLSRELKVFFK